MKVILACPTYGPVNPIVSRYIRISCLHAANNRVEFLSDLSPDRVPTGRGRSAVVQATLENFGHADGIMWVDSDTKPAREDMLWILRQAEGHGLDFLSALYFKRQPPYSPLAYVRAGDLFSVSPIKKGIFRVDGCGFGFAFTSTKMLKKMSEHKDFNPDIGWFPDTRDVGGFGEDLGFCDLAGKAGIELYVDGGVVVGHEAEARFITEKDFNGR